MVAWIAVDPEAWFPDAFAEKGEIGDPGPVGPRGPRGQAGPVGPPAQAAISQVANVVADLGNDISSLERRMSDVEQNVDGSFGTGIDADLEDLKSSVYDMCDDLEFALDLRLSCVLRFF